MDRSKNVRRGDRDRLSSLPDNVLHLIMSFLTVQDAVRTCVLSKRWKNLWTTLPYLNFDLENFEAPACSGRFKYDFGSLLKKKYAFERFEVFVSQALHFHEATDLFKFRLSCLQMPHTKIQSWINYALERNPQVLDIKNCSEGSLPVGVFSCASLVDLSLSGSPNRLSLYIGYNSKVINLPCLKRLHLSFVDLDSVCMMGLFRGCPVLEFLHLRCCKTQFCTIQSRSLKYLEVVEDNCGQYNTLRDKITDMIIAPNLLSFSYSGCAHYIEHKMRLKVPSLTTASICVGHCVYHRVYNGNCNILAGISSVKSLKLNGFWIKEFLENQLLVLRKFKNVKVLSVHDLCLSCHFNLLASFLEYFPNLQTLLLLHTSCVCEVKEHGNQEALKIAPFNCRDLHEVDIKFSKYDKNFHWVMKYLQDGTKNLYARIKMTHVV